MGNYGYYGYYMDPTYILVLIGALLSIVASVVLNNTFQKYAKVFSASGMTGAQAAERILRSNGIYDVRIEPVSGNLTDHYDPRNKVLRLSDATYSSSSVAAIGVAAHECGHAVQHQVGYVPLKIHSVLAPISNIGSKWGIPIVILGIILSYHNTLIQIGILVFAISVLFQIILLPVEFNASARAVRMVEQYGIAGGWEAEGCKKVLTAAAFTYVAGAAVSILQLLRLLLLFGRRRD